METFGDKTLKVLSRIKEIDENWQRISYSEFGGQTFDSGRAEQMKDMEDQSH